jgi:RimJ/RimL family protein N-acetyltransferase
VGSVGEQPVLTDGTVRLRPVDPVNDAELAWPWYQDLVVLWGSENTREPFGRDRVQRMYEALSPRGEAFIVEVRESGGFRAVGDASLLPDALPIVIGDASWRGRGLGRRVLLLLIARARALGWPELVAHCIYDDNVPSRRLFEGCGFRPVDRGVDGGRPWTRYRLRLQPDGGSAFSTVGREQSTMGG